MKQELFNDDWLFWYDENSFALVWSIPEQAQRVTLPHDAMISETPYAESKNGNNTGFRDGKNYVYVKTFTAEEEDLYRENILKFEGSYMNTFVYVNGQLAGKHHNGYTTFYVNMKDFLHLGENEIRVQVRNGAMSNSRWYSGGGLYRDVYLLSSDLLHVSATGSKIKTVELENDFARIEVSVPIENMKCKGIQFDLKLMVCDKDGKILLVDQRPYYLKAGENNEFKTILSLDKIQAWSAESPTMYRMIVELYQEGNLCDTDTQEFGIRTVSVDSKRGLRINGQQTELRGACIHHDSGLIGAATYQVAHYRQVRILKEAGFNAIRMAHNPAAPALLRICDELGMYVMDETFDSWTRFKGDFDYSLFFEESWKNDVSTMVETDFNHPSVILYSIGNEIPEIGTKHGSRIAKMIHDHIKDIDQTRPTLASINGVFAAGEVIPQIAEDIQKQSQIDQSDLTGNVNDFMTLMDTSMDKIVVHPLISQRLDLATASTDIAGYNYMSARYELDAKEHPNRVIVGSETYPPEIARNWSLVKKLASVIGDFTWTGWDYIGEAGVGIPAYNWGEGGFGARFPCQLAYCGDIDITGVRRPLSYYREIVFGLREKPYIAVQKPEHYGKKLIKTPWVLSDSLRSWTWPGFEGHPIVVEVYAPGDEVALYLNDQLIEKKSTSEELDYLTKFEIMYRKGCLKAVNFKDGHMISEDILMTADETTAHLQGRIEENGDLTYISYSIEDNSNNLITHMKMDLCIHVVGAELLGFGTGDPKPLEKYNTNRTSTFNGRALAIVRKFKQNAQVIVTSENMTVDLTV